MKKIDKNIKADAFVCQLSTNDATKEMPLGVISDSFNMNDFDTQTVAGAIEYMMKSRQALKLSLKKSQQQKRLLQTSALNSKSLTKKE